jgi:hypothetical protein
VLVLDTLVEFCIAARGESDTVESKVPLYQALVSGKPNIVVRDMVTLNLHNVTQQDFETSVFIHPRLVNRSFQLLKLEV